MKQLIGIILRNYINEAATRSELPANERHKIVAQKVIDYMDLHKLKEIPGYRFLQPEKSKEGNKFKKILAVYLTSGEYDGFVKPLIRQMRPDFSYPTQKKGKIHLVDEGVAVFSIGEVITYNTFKINGIKLKFEDPTQHFQYEMDGVIKTKRPDFYWVEKKVLIEVAGIKDELAFGGDYEVKLAKAKEKLDKEGKDLVILDYYTYKDNPRGFYKYVCETFNFEYNPENFWTVMTSKSMDRDALKRRADEIIQKGGLKTRGEKDALQKIVKSYLIKSPEDSEETIQGYQGVWDYRRQTGLGMRWADPELREKVQEAWCKSTGANKTTYDKFKELYPDIPFSKNTVENMKAKFPQEFDLQKREEICGQYMN